MKKTILIFIALINVFSFQILAQKKFEIADYAKMANLSDPQISPDGKYLAGYFPRFLAGRQKSV